MMKNAQVDNKILHVVKFNDHEALILEKKIELTYYKFDGFIIGTDGVFINGYHFDLPSKGFEAFGGSEFQIKLHDGSIEQCYGQWWGGLNDKAREYIGDDIISVTAKEISSLKECYVFNGLYALKKPFEEFRKIFSGTVHDYRTGEHLIKSVKPAKLKKRMSQDTVIDIHHCVYKYMFIEGKTHYKYLYSLDENFKHMNCYCEIKQPI